jgi:hypothetical protein
MQNTSGKAKDWPFCSSEDLNKSVKALINPAPHREIDGALIRCLAAEALGAALVKTKTPSFGRGSFSQI